ncbi:MAG TPA: single-stranded DNA-binding protein [Bacteroidales bacterium]|nr:single-stranded DNA-binding protein [Bacteroidales bacterium]
MATGINKVILIGNLGKDPDIQKFDNGVKKASFSLATTETYKNKDGEKTQHTEWHNIVLWRGLAEIAENYLKKGSTIYLEGKIRRRDWEDKDGQKRYTTDIIGDSMTMLGSGRRDSSAGDAPVSVKEEGDNGTTPLPEDDLPF